MDLSPKHDCCEDQKEETLKAEEDEEDDSCWWREVAALWRGKERKGRERRRNLLLVSYQINLMPREHQQYSQIRRSGTR